MHTVTSADGSTIAYQEAGTGTPLVCVPPAFGLRGVFEQLAAELSGDHRMIWYDRRGRGDSTDAIEPSQVASYRAEREIEDLVAVINAVGDTPAVLGYSSGGRLALDAAAAGVPMTKIAVYEPPYRPGETEIKTALVDKLAKLIMEGRGGDAVATFQTEGIGLPAEMVQGMRATPMFAALEAIAQTVVYDATITAEPEPSAAVRAITQPIAVLAGTETFPNLLAAARHAAEVINNATMVELPGGPNHQLEAATTGAALREFLR